VGVDVELVGGSPTPHLLTAVCSSVERASVLTPQDFFTYWVRKEAVLKATGEGMRREMTDVMVTRPDRQPRVLFIKGAETPTSSMTSISVDGYAGAVAVLAARPITFTFVDAGASLLDV
jgi:4'-phosphopantetheinyl transferase